MCKQHHVYQVCTIMRPRMSPDITDWTNTTWNKWRKSLARL